jgi:hypothetical protein
MFKLHFLLCKCSKDIKWLQNYSALPYSSRMSIQVTGHTKAIPIIDLDALGARAQPNVSVDEQRIKS